MRGMNLPAHVRSCMIQELAGRVNIAERGRMITGATRTKVDDIWQKMWEGGITNPLEVISQLTYLMFMHQLDEKEFEAEQLESMLDDKRDPDPAHDDIPDILERWDSLGKEHDRSRTDKSVLVPVQEIRDNDYDFSFNKYTETVYERIEYPPTEEILADLEAINERIATGLAKLHIMLSKAGKEGESVHD